MKSGARKETEGKKHCDSVNTQNLYLIVRLKEIDNYGNPQNFTLQQTASDKKIFTKRIVFSGTADSGRTAGKADRAVAADTAADQDRAAALGRRSGAAPAGTASPGPCAHGRASSAPCSPCSLHARRWCGAGGRSRLAGLAAAARTDWPWARGSSW